MVRPSVPFALLSLALSSLLGSPALGAPFELDPAQSTVTFEAHQAIFGDTVGTFHRFDAELDLDRDDVRQSSLVVRIEAASVDTGNEDRDEHLRKPDFFHVDAHPEIRFVSTRVEPRPGGATVYGRLEVKDRRTEVRLPLDLKWSSADGRLGVRARGTVEVDRYALGLDYDTPFFIPEISRLIELRVDARASRPLGATTSTAGASAD